MRRQRPFFPISYAASAIELILSRCVLRQRPVPVLWSAHSEVSGCSPPICSLRRTGVDLSRSDWCLAREAKGDLCWGSGLFSRFQTQRCFPDHPCQGVTCVRPRRQKVIYAEAAANCDRLIGSLRRTGFHLSRSDVRAALRSKDDLH